MHSCVLCQLSMRFLSARYFFPRSFERWACYMQEETIISSLASKKLQPTKYMRVCMIIVVANIEYFARGVLYYVEEVQALIHSFPKACRR